jgi:hypothetical protein
MYVIDMSESPKIVCLHVQEKCFRTLLTCGCLDPLISMFYMYGCQPIMKFPWVLSITYGCFDVVGSKYNFL